METGTHETVEFLDVTARHPADGSDRPTTGGSGRSPRIRSVLLAGLLVAGALVAARVLGAPPAVTAAAAAAPGPVFAGSVALPADFGVPTALATTAGSGTDVVFVLGGGGRVARVADGRVVGLSVGRGYRTLAVRPDGRGLYVSTGRLAPAVVALDPVALTPVTSVFVTGDPPAPVSALVAGGGSVWAATAGGLQGWTSDLSRALRPIALPPTVTAVRSLAVVGSQLQALVGTGPGSSALLVLAPPDGVSLSPSFAGAVNVVPGRPALLAYPAPDRTVAVLADPTGADRRVLARPLAAGAGIWPVGGGGWASSTAGGANLDCFDLTGALVGRMSVGDDGAGIRGPVVTTARAVYAVTVRGDLGRGGRGSCG